MCVCSDFTQMQCIRAFITQQPDELSLEKADVILVHQQSGDGKIIQPSTISTLVIITLWSILGLICCGLGVGNINLIKTKYKSFIFMVE